MHLLINYKSVQFVDVTCGAKARPNWTQIHQLGQDCRTEDLLNAIVTMMPYVRLALGEEDDVSMYMFLLVLPATSRLVDYSRLEK